MPEQFTERDLIGLLAGAYALKRQRDDLDKAYKTATKPVREWLEAHPGERLWDGENSLFATLQERSGSQRLDAMSLTEKRPDLLAWLASQGCLSLDNRAYAAVEDKAIQALDVKPFLMPGKRSMALILDKEKGAS